MKTKQQVLVIIVGSGEPGSKFCTGREDLDPSRDRDRDQNGHLTGPGLASFRPGPGPGFFRYFSVKMKQC